MKHYRISCKRVEKIAMCLNLRLVRHQNLGNRKDYYYTYSVVRDENGMYKETLLADKELKQVYSYLSNLLDTECKKIHDEIYNMKLYRMM